MGHSLGWGAVTVAGPTAPKAKKYINIDSSVDMGLLSSICREAAGLHPYRRSLVKHIKNKLITNSAVTDRVSATYTPLLAKVSPTAPVRAFSPTIGLRPYIYSLRGGRTGRVAIRLAHFMQMRYN
jgi:hypothetical protein